MNFTRKRRFWGLILAVLVCVGLVSCESSGRQGVGEIGADKLRVKAMTFNIRYYRGKDGIDGWEYRKGMVADIIRDSEADFIGLQEAEKPQVDVLMELVAEYGFLTTYSDGKIGGSSNTILYRKDRWEVEREGVFWLSDTPEVAGSKGWGNRGSRFCEWSRFVDKESGKGIYFYNAHLDHQCEYCRDRSMILITERIAGREVDDPFVLVGDFNAREHEQAVRFFKGKAVKVDGKRIVTPLPMVDTFRVKHGEEVDAGTFNGFGKREPFPKIDYVLTARPVCVLEAKVNRYNRDGRYPSDHCPVTAVLEFGK